MAEQNNQQKKGGQQQDANQLIQVRYDKLHELQANGKNPFEITKYDVTHHSTDIKDNFESLEGQEVTVAGRMMFKRVMGKASFCNVQEAVQLPSILTVPPLYYLFLLNIQSSKEYHLSNINFEL